MASDFSSARLVMNGAPLRLVQKYLGHSSVVLTERYGKVAPDYMKEGVRFFGAPRVQTPPTPTPVGKESASVGSR